MWAREARRQRAEAVHAATQLVGRALQVVRIEGDGWFVGGALGFGGDDAFLLDGCHRPTLAALQHRVEAGRSSGLGEVVLERAHHPGPFFALYFSGAGWTLPLLAGGLRAGREARAVV